MLFTNLLNEINASGKAVQLGAHDQLYVGVYFKCFFQRDGIHVPAFRFGIDEHRNAALINNGIQCCVKGHIGAEYTLALQRAVTDGRLSVQPFTGGFYAKMQRRGASRKSNRIFHFRFFSGDAFHLIDVCTDCGHPVRFICLGHVFEFFAMHGR